MDSKELEELHRMEKSVCRMFISAENRLGLLSNRVSRLTGKDIVAIYTGDGITYTYADDAFDEFYSIEDLMKKGGKYGI